MACSLSEASLVGLYTGRTTRGRITLSYVPVHGPYARAHAQIYTREHNTGTLQSIHLNLKSLQSSRMGP